MPLDMDEVREAFRGELKGVLEKRDEKANELHEQIEHLKTKREEETTDIKGRLDQTQQDLEKLNASITEAEKKFSRAMSATEVKSLGQQVIDSDEFKDVSTDQPGKWRFEAKDITNAGNVATGVSRNVLVPEQQSGMVVPPEQELRIRNLMPTGQTSSNSIRFIQETGYTNNAGMVEEAAAKPQSDLTFAEQVTPVQKIAHFFRVSMEVLDDAPMLRSYIDGRGRYGLLLKEEGQILTGNGTSPNLNGLLPQATAYNAATLAGYTPASMVDDIRIAKLQVRKALYPASGIVMSPEDWAGIELLKETDSGAYLYSSVTTGAIPRLWGLPVVTSDSMAPGDFLVGAFSLGAQIWDRMGMTVMASTEDGDNFKENMVTILFEKRLALEVSRPEAFVWHDESAGA